MNRGAVFSEDESLAEALGENLAELLDAIRAGRITDDHIAEHDQRRHAFFMQTLRRLAVDPETPAPSPLVLKSFSPDEDETFLISVAFMSVTEHGEQIETIVEFHAYPSGESYRFRSPFAYRTHTFDEFSIDEVRYRYRGTFDHPRAQEFVRFKRGFEARLGVETTALEYFCFETLDELLAAHGVVYDCRKCNWLKHDLGFMDDDGRRFLTGTGDERFIFDYIVAYMEQYCDDGDLYPPFVYGMAAYYGGYGLSGDDVETLKAQFRAELAARPEIDFLEEFQRQRKSSIERHFTYFVICAFVFEAVLERRGFDAAMRLARSGPNGERFFETLEELLGVGEDGFDELVARLISEDSHPD